MSASAIPKIKKTDEELARIVAAEDAAREEALRKKREVPPGFYSHLGLLLDAEEADQGGLHAWITAAEDGAPPARQKHTTLLREGALSKIYADLYEKALDTEAQATWYYLDQLACRACQLTRLKRDERQDRKVVQVLARERREFEEQEQSTRGTLEESMLQNLRLLGRDMRSKRALLSTTEYQSQLGRVAKHVESLLAGL